MTDWLLTSLGARPLPPGATASLVPALVDPLPAGEFEAGLPDGTLDYCTGVALALGAVAGVAVSGVGVALQLRLPEVMAEAYGSPFSMRPAPPRAAPGGGWFHADLGAPGDQESFELMSSTLPPSASAAEVAAAAQEWRLAVCDYRSRPAVPAASAVPPPLPASFATGAAGPPSGDHTPLRVLDLTNMWAGPLATWLLHGLGAEVTRVEPSFRPDGFRALHGGGIHPGGRQCDPGRDSAMWNALNAGKDVVDLDLRRAADARTFLQMAAESDVVIDSFSPRVMANFGLDLPAGPVYVSMPAFPPGNRRHWVAYGTGVHALAGLGDTGGGGCAAPSVSYPDPVAGLTAALAVVAAVAARRRGVPVGRAECPLYSAVEPLVAFAPPAGRSLTADPAGIGARLLELGRSRGLLESRRVCERDLPHPARMFLSKQNVF